MVAPFIHLVKSSSRSKWRKLYSVFFKHSSFVLTNIYLFIADTLANLLLQAQSKAYYNDELLDMLTSAEEIGTMNRQQFWQQFSEKMTSTIQQIIEFSKLIPGFTNLSQDDQIMVLKGG